MGLLDRADQRNQQHAERDNAEFEREGSPSGVAGLGKMAAGYGAAAVLLAVLGWLVSPDFGLAVVAAVAVISVGVLIIQRHRRHQR